MKDIVISTAEELLTELNELPNHYIYRGHADADWQLESSLERVVGDAWSAMSARRFEDYALDLFESKFHLYDRENIQSASKLAWLSIMQHYGVPTRLLDFTASPYVALYFALEGYSPRAKKDFAVFAIDYTAIMERSVAYISEKDPSFQETRQSVYEKQDVVFGAVVDTNSYDVAWITEPKQVNARLDRQAGTFLLSGNPASRIKDVLSSSSYSAVDLRKYRIPNQMYKGIFALLRKMNVTSKSLYGDLDGLARSIKMELQAYSS